MLPMLLPRSSDPSDNPTTRRRLSLSSPRVIFVLVGSLLATGVGTGELLGQPEESRLEQRVSGSAPMPRLLPSTAPKMPPIFVAADRVLRADGSVDPSLFRPGYVETIQSYLDMEPSADGCIRLDMTSSVHLPRTSGRPRIAEVIREKENTVLAEVTGRIYGYLENVPGTLLRVETQEVFKGTANRASYFIHFPEGSFEVGDRRICWTTFGFPSPPDLEDRVLLLYSDSELWHATAFMYVYALNVVVLPKSGTVRFSSFFTSDFETSAPVTSESFLDFTRTHLAQDPPEEMER